MNESKEAEKSWTTQSLPEIPSPPFDAQSPLHSRFLTIGPLSSVKADTLAEKPCDIVDEKSVDKTMDSPSTEIQTGTVVNEFIPKLGDIEQTRNKDTRPVTGLLVQNEFGQWFYWDAQGQPIYVPLALIGPNSVPVSETPASMECQPVDPGHRQSVPSNEIQSQGTIYYIPPMSQRSEEPLVPGPELFFQASLPRTTKQVPMVYQEPKSNTHPTHPMYPQALKVTQMNPESSSTLIDNSVSDILHEHPKSYKESALTDILSSPEHPTTIPGMAKKKGKKSHSYWIQFFRVFNLLRAVTTAIYSFKITADGLNNPDFLKLGARSLLYVSFVTTTIDLLVPMIRLWPTLLWCFWDVKTWDPYSRTWTVWALILDHDLLIDVLPILVNIIVKIYMYRVSELIANPLMQDTITNPDILIGSISDFLKYQNFVLLMCFVASLIYTLLFHGFKIWHFLAFKKKSFILGSLALIKTFLLTFDLLTNGLLLYKVLVFKGLKLFDLTGLISMTLSVVGPSPVVTLSTNALINLPVHYTNFRMRLKDLKSATQTFHLSLSPLYLYAIYSTVALSYILIGIQEVTSVSVKNLVPSSDFFGWNSSGTKNVLMGMLWTNVVLNYLAGMTLWLLWVFWSISSAICCKVD